MNFSRETLNSNESSHPLKCEFFFFQKFVDKILQKHFLCISSELLLYIYFWSFQLRSLLFKTYFKNCYFETKISNYLYIKCFLSWFYMFSLYNFILQRLTLPAPCIFESCIEIKINLNFYFHTSLWCLKRFYEGLKGLHKTFRDTTTKCENKKFKLIFSLRPGSGREGLIWKMISVNFYGLIIELPRNEKLQKYRIILSQHTNYLHKWLVLLNLT